jgi:hypothetical protein
MKGSNGGYRRLVVKVKPTPAPPATRRPRTLFLGVRLKDAAPAAGSDVKGGVANG